MIYSFMHSAILTMSQKSLCFDGAMWIDHVGFHPWWQNPKYVFYFTIECCIKGTPSHYRCIGRQHCYFCFIVAAIRSSNNLNVWCRRCRWVNRKITEDRYLVFQGLRPSKDNEILLIIPTITIYIQIIYSSKPVCEKHILTWYPPTCIFEVFFSSLALLENLCNTDKSPRTQILSLL